MQVNILFFNANFFSIPLYHPHKTNVFSHVHLLIFEHPAGKCKSLPSFWKFLRNTTLVFTCTPCISICKESQFYLYSKDHSSTISAKKPQYEPNNQLPQIPMHLMLQKSWHLSKTGYIHHQVSVASALELSLLLCCSTKKPKETFESQSQHNPNKFSLLLYGVLF